MCCAIFLFVVVCAESGYLAPCLMSAPSQQSWRARSATPRTSNVHYHRRSRRADRHEAWPVRPPRRPRSPPPPSPPKTPRLSPNVRGVMHSFAHYVRPGIGRPIDEPWAPPNTKATHSLPPLPEDLSAFYDRFHESYEFYLGELTLKSPTWIKAAFKIAVDRDRPDAVDFAVCTDHRRNETTFFYDPSTQLIFGRAGDDDSGRERSAGITLQTLLRTFRPSWADEVPAQTRSSGQPRARASENGSRMWSKPTYDQ